MSQTASMGGETREPVALRPGTPQLFLDDTLIADHRRLVRRWLPAKVYPRPVIEPDRPWEGRILAFYGTIVAVPSGEYRMYYSPWQPGVGAGVCLAISQDGFTWGKPDLGLVEYRGDKKNNIVRPTTGLDSPSLIYDPEDVEHSYKLIGYEAHPVPDGDKQTQERGLFAYYSADGVHFTPYPGVRLRAGDRTNVMATKTGGRYVIYTRHTDMMRHTGCRAIYRSESTDFLDWTEPELVLRPDLVDEPDVEFYGISVFERYGWFFGLLEYWRGDLDVIEIHLVFSRDGKSWIRPEVRAPFIAATHDWNRTWSSCASNGPLIIGEQMVFYFGGRWVSHHWDTAQQYGAIGYASLPLDRYCALEATTGGQIDTVSITWPGGDLLLNADTRDSFSSHPMHCKGEIAVEVLDAEGRPLMDWSGEKRALFRGNTHCRGGVQGDKVTWEHDKGLDLLRGQAIRLRFYLRHARLFSFQAGE